jgi:hypothetical protein
MKSIMNILLLGALTVLWICERTDAILCYDCKSTTSSGCSDPFSRNGGISTCSGGACGKAYTPDKSVVVRGCETSGLSNSCIDLTISGVKVTECYCYTDLCNAAVTSSPIRTWLLFIPAVVVALIRSV